MKDSLADKKALPRRVRFYHGKIAAKSLNSGADYDTLKNVVVIMIMPFDPFGQNHMVYTIKSKCVELPEMEYEDGASTLFLYTRGTEGIPDTALQQLLHYMEDTTYENAVNEELLEIHRMVEAVKKNSEVGGMRIQIIDENIKLAQKNKLQAAELKKMAGEKAKLVDKNTKLTDEKTKLMDKNTKLTDEKTRLAEENRKLREKLMRKDAAEKQR